MEKYQKRAARMEWTALEKEASANYLLTIFSTMSPMIGS
jgi:hypothetical protein